MIKTRCITRNILASDEAAVDEFINEFLEKHEVVQVIKAAFHTDNEYLSISVIYKADVISADETKGLLKKIVRLKSPVTEELVQTELGISTENAEGLLDILERLGILSSKKAGRWLLKSGSEASRIIDEWNM